jgi:hypothetical protein
MTATTSVQSLFLALVVLLSSACAATRPVMEWRDEGLSGPYSNLVVIAAIERSTRRRVFEDMFVQALEGSNVVVIPSYTLMTTEVAVSRETVEAAIKGKNIDAVLVTRLLGVKEEEVYKPPSQLDHHRNYHRYYTHSLEQSNPGSYRKYKILTLETNLYDTATQKLTWSMQSESIEPSTPRTLIQEQITLTIDKLRQQGLLAESE